MSSNNDENKYEFWSLVALLLFVLIIAGMFLLYKLNTDEKIVGSNTGKTAGNSVVSIVEELKK